MAYFKGLIKNKDFYISVAGGGLLIVLSQVINFNAESGRVGEGYLLGAGVTVLMFTVSAIVEGYRTFKRGG